MIRTTPRPAGGTFTVVDGPGERWAEIFRDPFGEFLHAYLGAGSHRFCSTTDPIATLDWITREAQ